MYSDSCCYTLSTKSSRRKGKTAGQLHLAELVKQNGLLFKNIHPVMYRIKIIPLQGNLGHGLFKSPNLSSGSLKESHNGENAGAVPETEKIEVYLFPLPCSLSQKAKANRIFHKIKRQIDIAPHDGSIIYILVKACQLFRDS